MTDEPFVHIHFSEKEEGLPEVGGAKKCSLPNCPAPQFETGFGLAGGGYGPYEFCDTCGLIVSKTTIRDDEE